MRSIATFCISIALARIHHVVAGPFPSSIIARQDVTTSMAPVGLEMRPKNVTSRIILQSYGPSGSSPLNDIQTGGQELGTVTTEPRDISGNLYTATYPDTSAPGFSLTVSTYQNITCNSTPYPNYNFGNGTTANVTFQEVVAAIVASNTSMQKTALNAAIQPLVKQSQLLLSEWYGRHLWKPTYADLVALDKTPQNSQWTVSLIGNMDYQSGYIYTISRSNNPVDTPEVDYKSLAAASLAFVATGGTKMMTYISSAAVISHIDSLSILILALVWTNLIKLAQETWTAHQTEGRPFGADLTTGYSGLGSGAAEAGNAFEPLYAGIQFHDQVELGLTC